MKHFVLFLLCTITLFFVAAQSPQLVIPVGHTDQVTDAIFSKDSRYIATASQDNTAKVWDARTGKLLQTLYGHRNLPGRISFSNNNKYLATMAFPDSTAFIWNLENGTRAVEFDSISNPYNEMPLFSNSGEYVAVKSKTGIAIWNIREARLIKNLLLRKINNLDRVKLLGFLDNDETIAFFLIDRDTLDCMNIASGKLKRRISTGIYSGRFYYAASSNSLVITNRSAISIIDLATGKLIKRLTKSINETFSQFSKDGKYLLNPVAYKDSEIRNMDTVGIDAYFFKPVIRDLLNNKDIPLAFDPFESKVNDVAADDSLNHLAVFGDSVIGFYTRVKNKYVLKGTAPTMYGSLNQWVTARQDGAFFIVPDSRNAIVYTSEGKIAHTLQGSMTLERNQDFSDDGKYITTGKGPLHHCWDIVKGKFDAGCEAGNAIEDNPAKKKNEAEVLLDAVDSTWKVVTSTDTVELKGYHSERLHASVAPGGKYIVSYWGDDDSLVRIWEAATGEQLWQLKLPMSEWPVFNGQGNMVVLTKSYSGDRLSIMWDNLQKELDGEPVADTGILPNYIVNVIDLPTGKSVFSYIDADTSKFFKLFHIYPGFSKSSKYFTLFADHIRIWETLTWRAALNLDYGCGYRSPGLSFNSKGDKILVSCTNSTMLYETFTNKLLATLPGSLNFANFSEDEKYILAGSADKRLKIFDAVTGKLLYTYFGFKGNDYLVTDEEGHYDGSENARQLLYFNCGKELVDLAQVKDQLWVPGLAERIMKGDSINAPKLHELDICGVTPLIENKEDGRSYHFKITPRKNGLGESVLYINNIEVKRWQSSELVQRNNSFDLIISKDSLSNYFVSDTENQVSLKSYTAKNEIASRGLNILHKEPKKAISPPNLYAVMIGISDYKGTELDLKYASKDAADLSVALAASARKLLNTDGKEHVFMYNLTTEGQHYLLPEKKAIQKTLEEIGHKAAPNDILFLFFAGHGVMAGEQKQFYFLTADASKDAVVAIAGISTAELTEWMKPANIKAQKRILIFDACNSGQAINDLITIGKEKDKYVAARNDDNTQQIKAIDKLNERSGLFILAASASDQSAYEMGRYSQGLLTYALLKAIKEQPGILEDDKYLNVSRWFNAAEIVVSELVRETGNRQEPQLVSTANFNIGIVDADVIAGIILPAEKPLFTASNFQNNDESIADDDIELSKNINQVLFSIASRGAESKISYITVTQSPDAYTLSGRYEIKGDVVTVKASIKQNKQTKHRFEITGSSINIRKIAEDVVTKASELML
jgi:WD40 repeat protein/uncharacterized caspase-like protein